MKENTAWIIVIGAVAIAGIGFASFAKEVQVSVLIGGFASSICVSLLTLLKTNQTAAKQDVTSAKVDVASAKVDVAAKKAEYTANLVQENAVHTDNQLGHLTDVVIETKASVKKVEVQSNSAQGSLLRRSAEILRSFANSSKNPIDEKVAASAEKDYAEHEQGQAIIASGVTKPNGDEARINVADDEPDRTQDTRENMEKKP